MDDVDWADMADLLELEAETQSQYLEQAIDEPRHLSPKRVLGIGSGPGVAACLLEAAFDDAGVSAVDGSAGLLARAEQRARRVGVRPRTTAAVLPPHPPAGLDGRSR